MCDSFDMACRDASNALQLNIKVNSENLLPNPQKYNVGSLRLPADPSWPKIPQRRLVDDLDDVIEPPCVVTLTGTPRKSRTTVRPSNSHLSSRSNFTKDQVPASFHQNVYQKIPTVGHTIKRRPGCADPRFKKVTTVKSQVTSTDPPDRERENPTEISRSAVIIPNQTQCTNENVRKTVPEKDTDVPKVTQQEAEKPGEIRGMDSIGVQTMSNEISTIDEPKKNFNDPETSKDDEISKKIVDDVNDSKDRESSIEKKEKIEESTMSEKKAFDVEKKIETDQVSSVKNENQEESEKINFSKDENPVPNTIISNNPVNVTAESTCLQYCQGNNTGPFFLVVENNPQSSSHGTIKIDTNNVKACQYATQCYNVQVPVLSYQNLPLQISTQQQTPKIDIKSQLSLSPVITIPSSPALDNNNHHQHHHQFEISRGNFSRITENRESTIKQTTNESFDKEKTKNNDISSELDEEQRTRKMLATPPVKLERKQEISTNYEISRNEKKIISQSFEASRVGQLLSDTTDSEIYPIIDKKQSRMLRSRVCTKETSGSGSDYDVTGYEDKFRVNEQSNQIRKKRRNPMYSSTMTSEEIVFKKNYENNCRSQQLESSFDDEETSRQDFKTRTQRRMKSEQNLPRTAPFCGKSYKNISDPHITTRETRGARDSCHCVTSYARRRNDDRLHEETSAGEEASLRRENNNNNNKNNEHTMDEIDLDIPNVPEFCETHRTDASNVEEKNPGGLMGNNETTDLPVKTQQLLNKSYMEYYDKLRSSNNDENSQQSYVCQMAMGAPKLKKRRAETTCSDMTKNGDERDDKTEVLTLEKLSALSNIINRNLNPALRNSSDTMQTRQLYVNENMKSSSDPTAVTQSAVATRKIATGNSADPYESSVPSSAIVNKVKRKREKPVERRLLKLKTIAFFGFMMYAMIVLLPMMYTYFLYEEYEDYEDLSYIELMLEYVVSSFREAFGGVFDTMSEILFRPVSLD